MDILLKDNTLISESVLSKRNSVEYGKIFEKMGRYSKMSVNALTESRYYRNYNPDILFSINEQSAVIDMLCTLRMHLFEEMKVDLKNYLVSEGMFSEFGKRLSKIGNDIKTAAGNAADSVKNAARSAAGSVKTATTNVKDKIDRGIDKLTEKFKSAYLFLTELIKKGITSVRELLKAFGQLLIKLGGNLSTALGKLGAFKSDKDTDEQTDINISKEMAAADIPEGERTFFTHVVEFVSLALNNKEYRSHLSESFPDVMDKIGNNKVFQYVFSVSKDRKKWSWIHTILVSLVGTFVISVILPMFLTCLGTAASTITVTTVILGCLWNTRSLLRVIFNRWLSKDPGEKFWNWQTVLGVILSTVPIALLRIPAVNEWFVSGLTSFCKWLGVDKLVDSIEELLAKLVEKCGGVNWTEETITTPGYTVEETIESYTHAGDAHVDLMTGNSGHEYIDHLFADGAHIPKFEGNTDALKNWLTSVCDAKYNGSMGMLNSLSGSLSSDAPLTAVLDGNTFGHIPRATLMKAIEKTADAMNIHCEVIDITNDALRTGTSGWAGTAYGVVFDANATSENVVLIDEMMRKVAKEVGAKATPGYGTFSAIANQVADTVTVIHDEVTNIVTTHILFDTLMQCFTPVFIPFFDKSMWGKYSLRMGSNTSGYTPYPVTEVKHMKLDEVAQLDPGNPALVMLVKHVRDVLAQHKSSIQSGIDQSKAANNGNISPKNKKALSRQIKSYTDNTNIAERELMVIFCDVKYKKKDSNGNVTVTTMKKVPAVAMDIQTMYCADIAPWFKKRRKNIYPVMGLFARLDFIPVKKNDNETKEFIYQMLEKFTDTAIKAMVSFGTAACYIVNKDKKYEPSDPSQASVGYFDTGGFSAEQICEVLNGKKDAYSYLDGRYSKNVSIKTDADGNIVSKKQRENNRLIEKKRFKMDASTGKFVEDKNGAFDYVDARVIPFANKACIDEIKSDKDLATLFLNKKQDAIDTAIINDPDLNIKQWLFRPAKTFSKEDKHKLGDSIRKYLKDTGMKDLKNGYILCKKFIEIIWRAIYAHIEKVYAKRNANA